MSAIEVRPSSNDRITIKYGSPTAVRIIVVPGPPGPRGPASESDYGLRADLDRIDDLSLLFDNGLI